MKMIFRTILIGCVLLIGLAVVDGLFSSRIFIMEAQARPGRPGRPGVPGVPGVGVPGVPGVGVPGVPGVHGGAAVVAHRTTRRVIRRTAIYAAALPDGCQTVIIEGTTLEQCGGTYYMPSGDQYVVVEID